MPTSITPNQAGWRPPQWSRPAMVSVTVPPGYSISNGTNSSEGVETNDNNGIDNPLQVQVASQQTYVFDAILALDHDQTLTKTHHPVQTGASVSSHAYIEPASVVMSVLMSDTAAQYTAANQTTAPYIQQWTGNASKSVSAYQQMLALQLARIPLTVTTRLRTYINMLITKVSPREDHATLTGVRFRLEFEQIFIANIQAAPISARPNDTSTTGLGSVNPQPVPGTVTTQFAVPVDASTNTLTQDSDPVPAPTAVDVPGAGTYSSVPQQFSGGSPTPGS
jgi:hypothetical protein